LTFFPAFFNIKKRYFGKEEKCASELLLLEEAGGVPSVTHGR